MFVTGINFHFANCEIKINVTTHDSSKSKLSFSRSEHKNIFFKNSKIYKINVFFPLSIRF